MCGRLAVIRLAREQAVGLPPAHPAERNVRMSINWLDGMHPQMDGPGQPMQMGAPNRPMPARVSSATPSSTSPTSPTA